MKTKIVLWVNTVVIAAVAVWFFVAPAVGLIGDVRDPALASGGIPRCVFAWHRHLAPDFERWALGTMQGGGGAHVGQEDIKRTEWPAHSAMFFLLATESLQKAWERDRSLSKVAPAVYARGAIDASAALLMDPVNATWVRNWWGDESYLKSQDVFFRMMVMNGLTAHLALTGDRRYAEFLRGQADSLAAELDASKWGLLDDYPGQCYPVDIVPAIAGIQRVDRLLGTDHSSMIARAERLLEGRVIDPATGLPGYFVDMHTAEPLEPARGIGMSMTLVWTPQLWPARSADWYASYVKQFWQQDALLAGFREFRKGSGKPEWQDEVDAGPVIAGYGTSASAVGIGAANANGDYARARLLEMQAMTAAWPLPDGTMPGARVLSIAEAPYTGVTAVLFALTRPSNPPYLPRPPNSELIIMGNYTVHPTPAPIPPVASTRTPGFVILFIGGGLAIGLLILLLAYRRVRTPCREMHNAELVIWGALMAVCVGLWFVHPLWSLLAWIPTQLWPFAAKKKAGQKFPITNEAQPAQ